MTRMSRRCNSLSAKNGSRTGNERCSSSSLLVAATWWRAEVGLVAPRPANTMMSPSLRIRWRSFDSMARRLPRYACCVNLSNADGEPRLTTESARSSDHVGERIATVCRTYEEAAIMLQAPPELVRTIHDLAQNELQRRKAADRRACDGALLSKLRAQDATVSEGRALRIAQAWQRRQKG